MPLALLFVWAAPARADTAVPQAKTWRDGCAARLDAAAKNLGLRPGARASLIPLRREDGTANPVQYVQYGSGDFTATAGDESETRPDIAWKRTGYAGGETIQGEPTPPKWTWFRRLHNRFGKMEGSFSGLLEREFRRALDECLQMGEAK